MPQQKTVVDGITFDSRREARRYGKLMLLQRAGVVLRFELQPDFTLQPGYRGKDGRWVRPIKYRADFRIWWASGAVTVEDVKASWVLPDQGVSDQEEAAAGTIPRYEFPGDVTRQTGASRPLETQAYMH